MRNPQNVFHLAIPCKSLPETRDFYNNLPGCSAAREYHDRVTINFFGDQVVCHLSPESIDEAPKMYPRHFGITFHDESEFRSVHQFALANKLRFYRDIFIRFKGKREQHETFFLIDPSNNLLEFKYYKDPEMVY